jgi:hypothetical protein
VDYRTDSKKSRTIYECCVCGAYTDRLQIRVKIITETSSGSKRENPGDPEFRCPNAGFRWHKRIEAKLDLLLEKPHPWSYCDELIKEILALRRQYRKERVDDVSGKLERKKVLIEPDKNADSAAWRFVLPLLRRKSV